MGGLNILFKIDDRFTPKADAVSGDLFRSFAFVLGFLIVFRSQKAYERWWEGGTLLQQLRGEWFNAFSSMLAFSNTDPSKADQVEKFQHLLVRLMSLLYGNALKQVSSSKKIQDKFEFFDLDGLDVESLEFMIRSHDSCEIVLQWIQRLIVQANSKDVLKIAPPILARVYNQLGNGIVKLNNARKIREFPIPFPLAQMISIMLLINLFMTAVVCAMEADHPVMAGVLAYVLTLVVWSINSIAVELEQPYGDDANDLPLIEMQEDMNKSLCALLKPLAGTPPSFAFQRDVHLQLSTSQKGLVNAVLDVTQRSRKSRKTRRQTEIMDHTQVVENCQEGYADEGSAVEGSCEDKNYSDTGMGHLRPLKSAEPETKIDVLAPLLEERAATAPPEQSADLRDSKPQSVELTVTEASCAPQPTRNETRPDAEQALGLESASITFGNTTSCPSPTMDTTTSSPSPQKLGLKAKPRSVKLTRDLTKDLVR